jgi:hypothetical protein
VGCQDTRGLVDPKKTFGAPAPFKGSSYARGQGTGYFNIGSSECSWVCHPFCPLFAVTHESASAVGRVGGSLARPSAKQSTEIHPNIFQIEAYIIGSHLLTTTRVAAAHPLFSWPLFGTFSGVRGRPLGRDCRHPNCISMRC